MRASREHRARRLGEHGGRSPAVAEDLASEDRERAREGEELRDTEKGEREKGGEKGSRHTNGCTSAGL